MYLSIDVFLLVWIWEFLSCNGQYVGIMYTSAFYYERNIKLIRIWLAYQLSCVVNKGVRWNA